MAQTLNIWRTSGGGYTNYTSWLHTPANSATFHRTHGLNQPQALEFYLTDGVTSFVAPEAGNRVQVITTTLANYFTGYIVNTPKRVRMGMNSAGSPIHSYYARCVDESLALEWKTATIFPTLAPFVSKTQGEILTELISLLGSSLTTTNVDDGIVIPYFRVRPEEGFWDVVRRLSDRTNMAFWVTAGAAWYVNFNDAYIHDYFERAILGPDWTVNTGSGAFGFVLVPGAPNNTFIFADDTAGVVSSMSWVGSGVSADQFSQAKLGALPAATRQVGVTVRNKTDATKNYYSFSYRSGAGCLIEKVVAGTPSTLAFNFTALVPGDVIRLSATGSILNAYVNGIFALTATDTTFTSGRPGIAITSSAGAGTVGQLDDFLAASTVPFGYSAVQTDAVFDPESLDVAPVDNPVFNDVVGLGKEEPQSYVREYFVGDGFNGSFPLKLPVYGAESSKLLEDDFSGTAIDSGTWTETDPASLISITGNSLVFAGGPSASNHRLSAKQLLEIAGTVTLRAGRIRFTAPTAAIIGGVFSADTGLIADCVAGFKATVNGATTRLQAIVSGAATGATFDVSSGKTYQLVVTINCSRQARQRRSYFSTLAQYGGEDVAADATISFAVTELPNSEGDAPTRVLDHSATISGIDQFLYYTVVSGPGNGTDSVGLILNFCLLRRAIQLELWTKKPSDADYVQRTLGDKADAEAVAVLSVGTEGNEVSFFADNIPEAGELGRVFYREGGIARARVRSDSSITSEAAKSGGTGVKAGYLESIEPTPRDSIELEWALQAYIDDHTTQFYGGTWRFTSQSYTLSVEPLPGRIITVNVPAQYAQFSALVKQVVLDYVGINRETGAEIFETGVDFGMLTRLEQIAPLDTPEDALTGSNDRLTSLDSVEFNSVGTAFAKDVPDAAYDGTLTSSTIEIDAGRAPTDGFEVRSTNAAWGTDSPVNLIAQPTTQTFTVPRTSRDALFFIKDYDVSGTMKAFQQSTNAFQTDAFQQLSGAGTKIVSRFPSLVRVIYPLPPGAPSFSYAEDAEGNFAIQLILGNPDDVYGVEIRDSDDATILYSYSDILLALQPDHTGLRYIWPNPTGLATKTLYARTMNLLVAAGFGGEYSAATTILLTAS